MACCLLAVNAPSALLCIPRFPEPIGVFLFLRTEVAENTFLVLSNDKVE